jgi:two-component system response regulator YesN
MKKRSKSEITKLALKARDMIQEKRQANSKLLCDEAIRIIDEEYGNEELSLAYVCDKLHVSVSYLSTLIKKVSGKSFVTLLTERRMEAAKELILYSQKKMLAIAEECGYSDNHYFSYSFKKYFGVSPRKMRETVKNAEA